jgi:hypothetical protein
MPGSDAPSSRPSLSDGIPNGGTFCRARSPTRCITAIEWRDWPQWVDKYLPWKRPESLTGQARISRRAGAHCQRPINAGIIGRSKDSSAHIALLPCNSAAVGSTPRHWCRLHPAPASTTVFWSRSCEGLGSRPRIEDAWAKGGPVHQLTIGARRRRVLAQTFGLTNAREEGQTVRLASLFRQIQLLPEIIGALSPT